jgi:hypothetical protein
MQVIFVASPRKTKAPANKWSGLFLPFNLKQCGLRRVRKKACLLDPFTLAGNALTVTGAILKQVEHAWCEAEFILRNRQWFSPFHNPIRHKNGQPLVMMNAQGVP